MALPDIFEKIGNVISSKITISFFVGSMAVYALVQRSEFMEKVSKKAINKAERFSTKTNKLRTSSSQVAKKTDASKIYKETAKISAYDQSNFLEPLNSENVERNSERTSFFQNSSMNSQADIPLIRQETGSDILPTDPVNSILSTSEEVFLGTGKNPVPLANAETKKKFSTSTSDNTPSPFSPSENSCSPNITGGSFGNPVGITLACNYSSTIKYCLSDGACCDPETDGTTYSVPVVIGHKNGNFCLSYIGNSDSGGASVLYHQYYTINSNLPNLSVGLSKTFYQTTELNATSFISSLDFGKQNFSVGQINLKSHDPGPDDLNYDCAEIIANYVDLPPPQSIEVLPFFNVSLATINSQVEIPLRVDQLDYGDNFITSYIENNNFVAPVYSCSTTKINLDDFEYFQTDDSQSESGDNSVREFEGQFTSYGFFEPSIANEIRRKPAGTNTEDNTGENLKSEMLGIFY
jgi:hypothetical protein